MTNLLCLARGHQWRWLVSTAEATPSSSTIVVGAPSVVRGPFIAFTDPAGGTDRCSRCRQTRPHWRPVPMDARAEFRQEIRDTAEWLGKITNARAADVLECLEIPIAMLQAQAVADEGQTGPHWRAA